MTFRCMHSLVVWAVLTVPLFAEAQLGEALTWIPVPNAASEFLMVQKTKDSTLALTPNNCFFPRRGPKAEGQGTEPDVNNLNGGKSFASITNLSGGTAAEWGVWFAQTGQLQVTADFTQAAQYSVFLGTRKHKLSAQRPTTISIITPGQYSLRVTCDRPQRSTTLQRLTLAGPAVNGAAVIRKRWRPAAAHTKFSSSGGPGSVRMWIMEMDAVPGPLGFYCPVTTPFGYFGPTWQADGTVNSSFNFSLWSYGRNQKEPPVERLSHLTAIGSASATFGHFGHEGTGVKVRGWEPLAGQQNQKQAFALRVEPGDRYDTYFSYFYSGTDRQWKLFAVGKKYNQGKPLKSLWVGSFVEVPGPPHVQRTGAYTRRMKYRGWVMGADQQLYRLDHMKNGNIDRATGYTHTNRGVTDDGWFFLETGGWTFRTPPNDGKDITLQQATSNTTQPEFLAREKLQSLLTMESEIAISGVKRSGNQAELTFQIRGMGTQPTVTAYWGPHEGLTFPDRWQHNIAVDRPAEGTNHVTVPDVSKESPLYVRILLRNSAGQFWTSDTFIHNK